MRFKNVYGLVNLRALKFSILNKNRLFPCMSKIFCRISLWTSIEIIYELFMRFMSSQVFLTPTPHPRDSGNGFSPVRHTAITWTDDDSIGPSGKYSTEIWIEIKIVLWYLYETPPNVSFQIWISKQWDQLSNIVLKWIGERIYSADAITYPCWD